MKRKIINTLHFLLFISQAWRIHRFFFQKNKITVLLFHDLNPKKLDMTIRILKKHYNVIDYKEFRDMATGKTKITGYPLIVTFDDGRIDNLKLVDGFLQSKIRPMMFLSTHISRLDGVQFISSAQIPELAKAFDIGSHTHTHPRLPKLTEEELFTEMKTSKEILEQELDYPIDSIAFPYGLYSEQVMKIGEKVGYKYQFTVDAGYFTPESDTSRICRVCLSDDPNKYEFYIKMTGMFDLATRKKADRWRANLLNKN